MPLISPFSSPRITESVASKFSAFFAATSQPLTVTVVRWPARSASAEN